MQKNSTGKPKTAGDYADFDNLPSAWQCVAENSSQMSLEKDRTNKPILKITPEQGIKSGLLREALARMGVANGSRGKSVKTEEDGSITVRGERSIRIVANMLDLNDCLPNLGFVVKDKFPALVPWQDEPQRARG